MKLAATGVLASMVQNPVLASLSASTPSLRFKAVAFDGFTILDPRPIFARCETLFPGHGAALANAWKSRQFEYTWLRVVGRHYADFWQVTNDALTYAAQEAKVELTADKRAQLMDAYMHLGTWPDALPVLQKLHAAGLKLAFLSNFTPAMLASATRSAGLEGLVTQAISTDTLRTYKPDPAAYQLGVDTLGLAKEEILFVAFGGWDAAGAKWFGYPTFWANRLGQPVEELTVRPDAIGRTFHELSDFVFNTAA